MIITQKKPIEEVMAAELIAKIKDEKLCDGVHIMAIGAEKNVPTILEKSGIC